MSQPLLALTSGELQRLAACIRALPHPPGEAALHQHQIASDRSELRQQLLAWLQDWSRRGGCNASLVLTLELLLEQRRRQGNAQAELVWSGPDGGPGDITRDQAVLIRELVDSCEQRLLITTFNIYRGAFIRDLFERIQQRLERCPALEARLVLNIPRPKGSTVVADQLREAFLQTTWRQLWDPGRPQPRGYFDPRSLDLGRDRPCVFHVKCCVADDELLVTSANLSDSAQFDNCELGLYFPGASRSPELRQSAGNEQSQGKSQSPGNSQSAGNSRAEAVWSHFDRLMQRQPAALVPIDQPLNPSL